MYFDPFTVSQLTDEKIVEIITSSVAKCKPEAETVTELTENIMYLTDVLFLYGEMRSRNQERYSLLKYENDIKEKELVEELKKASTEKKAADFYKMEAAKQMKKDMEAEFKAQGDVKRLELAYDATQEKINAVKKKIEALKYEFAAQ